MLLFFVCALRFFFPNSYYMPDVLFTLSQTPTPGNKNIVGFIHIIFLFEIKMTESLNRERESTSFCSHITALYLLFTKHWLGVPLSGRT